MDHTDADHLEFRKLGGGLAQKFGAISRMERPRAVHQRGEFVIVERERPGVLTSQASGAARPRHAQAPATDRVERFAVPLKPGNAGGGKGPWFKTDATSGEGPGDWET